MITGKKGSRGKETVDGEHKGREAGYKAGRARAHAGDKPG